MNLAIDLKSHRSRWNCTLQTASEMVIGLKSIDCSVSIWSSNGDSKLEYNRLLCITEIDQNYYLYIINNISLLYLYKYFKLRLFLKNKRSNLACVTQGKRKINDFKFLHSDSVIKQGFPIIDWCTPIRSNFLIHMTGPFDCVSTNSHFWHSYKIERNGNKFVQL